MQHQYSTKLSYKAKKGMFPAMRGKLFEGDVEIATFKRAGVSNGWISPIEYKFHSQGARNRFDDFADCLSIEESIEALIED